MTEDPSPADVFARLSDPTRVSVLLALDDADGTPLPFSALHARVDCGDSARFNYHLQKLRPRFVRKSEDGYDLSAAGDRVVRAIRAGVYAERPRIEETAVDGACGVCGDEGLLAAYEDGEIRLDCPDCERRLLEVRFPPSGVRDRGVVGTLRAFDRWSRLMVAHAADGVCPTCAGVAEGGIEESDGRVGPLASFRCRVCDWSACASLGAVARRDDRVRDFHRRRGVDLRERYYWEIPQYVDDAHVDVRSRDPWRVAVDFPLDAETCRAVVDGSLDVVDVHVGDSTGFQ